MQIQTLYMAYADNYKAEYIILHHTVSTVHLAKSLKLFSNVLCIHKGNAFLQEILCWIPMNAGKTWIFNEMLWVVYCGIIYGWQKHRLI